MGVKSVLTLYVSRPTSTEIQAWILRQLRGTNKRTRLWVACHPAWSGPEAARTQFTSELSHLLRSGAIYSLDLWYPFPMT